MTKLDRFEIIPLSIPYARPCAGGKGSVAVSFSQDNPVLIRMWTADGLSGFGYAKVFSGQFVRPMVALMAELASRIMGRDARSVTAIGDELRFLLAHAGNTGLAQYALAAVETALWDIKARAANLPLFRLLGGEKQEIPVYANHLLWRNWTPDELAEDSRKLIESGFRAIKMNAGRRPIAEDIARMQTVRDAVGPDIALHVDANWSWEFAEALRFVREAEALNLAWIEDPLSSDSPRELALLSTMSTTTVAAGELMTSPAGVLAFLQAGATTHLQLDLQYMGGIGGWMRGAAVADAFGVKVASHLFHEVSAHMASASRNASIVEYMSWCDVLYAEPMRIRDGMIVIPDAPGLGLELDEAALRGHAMS